MVDEVAVKKALEKKIQTRNEKNHQCEQRPADGAHLEHQYRMAFELSGAPSMIIDADMTLTMVNQEFVYLTGYTRKQIEGRMKWTAFIAEDDIDRMKRYHAGRREMRPDIPSEYECRVIDRSGHSKDIFAKVSMLDKKRSIASFMDITSRKQAEHALRMSEAKLSAMIEATAAFIYTATSQFHIDFMNKALITAVGGNLQNNICHKAIYNLDTPCRWCPMDRVIKGKSVVKDLQNPANGKWYHTIYSPILDENGQSSKIHVMGIDITERKLKENALEKAQKRLRKENLLLKTGIRERFKFGEIVGKSVEMQLVYEQIINAAAVDANVIVYGESGTGKELTAKTIHELSDRNDKPFVVVNCGAIPENLLESEFFGYCKGAFTGAGADRQGYLDLADGGTLFLDEIGEIGLGLQVKLLRVLEGGGYMPVGGNKLKQPDIRIIAATNEDLVKKVRKGDVRLDFFYRIHIVPINMPPLRNRKEDLPLLVDHFFNAYEDREKLPPLTGEIIERINQYSWPGNVRELRNTLRRYVTLKKFDTLDPSLFALDNSSESIDTLDKQESLKSDRDNLRSAIETFEKEHITDVLVKHRWQRNQAATALGINRKTLFRKIRRHGIE
ncbi:sigma 54-interacting transcriptional regulator [Desulfocicer niacini]